MNESFISSPDFSPANDTLEELGNGGALQAAGKQVPADNHPVARRATLPDPGGELLKTLPSSVEEGWRAERRGGCNRKFKCQGISSAACLAPPFQNRGEKSGLVPGKKHHRLRWRNGGFGL